MESGTELSASHFRFASKKILESVNYFYGLGKLIKIIMYFYCIKRLKRLTNNLSKYPHLKTKAQVFN